jgi:formylglycine-generating enzyme required for sulfatase activity
MAPLDTHASAQRLHAAVRQARAHTDALFARLAPETLLARPVAERHRLIFYVGHLDAFDWNLLARRVLDVPAFAPEFDRLFEFGIDPPPGEAPADASGDWPALTAVQDYVRQVRKALDAAWHRLPAEHVLTALEHRWMHAETLAYLLHELPPQAKRAPGPQPLADAAPPDEAWIAIATGDARLGQHADAFGWDNEFAPHTVAVPAFEIAQHKVTNGAYLRFVADGGTPPHFWRRADGGWRLRRMFDEVPLPLAAPVYLTHAQATAYAQWRGARLPSEAEWQRAAYGDGARRYPWGDAPWDATRGALDFCAWDPLPVTAHPHGATPEGVQQILGNGWEWTSSTFAPFAGFAARGYYRGYSADFFDGAHFVLKGASPRTALRLARPSFRNWFRGEYPYAYTTARLAR